MAATSILASGSTAASSADQTLAAGATGTLLINGSGSLAVEMKTAAGGYRNIGSLSALSNAESAKQLTGPIVFRVTRSIGQTAGCDLATS